MLVGIAGIFGHYLCFVCSLPELFSDICVGGVQKALRLRFLLWGVELNPLCSCYTCPFCPAKCLQRCQFPSRPQTRIELTKRLLSSALQNSSNSCFYFLTFFCFFFFCNLDYFRLFLLLSKYFSFCVVLGGSLKTQTQTHQ